MQPFLVLAALLLAYGNTALAMTPDAASMHAGELQRAIGSHVSHRRTAVPSHTIILDPSTGLLLARPTRIELHPRGTMVPRRGDLAMRLDPATGLLRPPQDEATRRRSRITPTRLDPALGIMVPLVFTETDARRGATE